MCVFIFVLLFCLKVYQAHVKQKSLLKSYFLIQSLDRSLFGGCYCCKPNPVNLINYGQTHSYEWWDLFCMIFSLYIFIVFFIFCFFVCYYFIVQWTYSVLFLFVSLKVENILFYGCFCMLTKMKTCFCLYAYDCCCCCCYMKKTIAWNE